MIICCSVKASRIPELTSQVTRQYTRVTSIVQSDWMSPMSHSSGCLGVVWNTHDHVDKCALPDTYLAEKGNLDSDS